MTPCFHFFCIIVYGVLITDRGDGVTETDRRSRNRHDCKEMFIITDRTRTCKLDLDGTMKQKSPAFGVLMPFESLAENVGTVFVNLMERKRTVMFLRSLSLAPYKENL